MWARNKLWIFGLLALAAVLCGVGVMIVLGRQKPTPSSLQSVDYSTSILTVNGKKYILQMADTPAKQALGLGQRDNMMPRAGMVFPYAKPTTDLCFWMKDMRFSIDIIWLDAHKQITLIEPSLSPATYPQSYCPSKPSQYVVELNAGVAHNLGLRQGQKLDFIL